MTLLSWIFPYKFFNDGRAPLLTVELPVAPFAGNSDATSTTFGFYMFDSIYWIETLSLVFLMCLLNGAASTITYKFIIEPKLTAKSIPVSTFLLAFGLIIPFWLLYVPDYAVQLFDVRNKVQTFCFVGIVPNLVAFRTVEALFDCTPSYAKESMASYAFYSVNPMILKRSESGFVRATIRDTLGHLKAFVIQLLILGALQSFLVTADFHPFGSTRDGKMFDPSRLFNPHQFLDNIFYGLIFQCYLATYGEGLLFATTALTGIRCEPFMLNPMMKSVSPSDFWARRWNMVVHGSLKRGVYIPMRKLGAGRLIAALGAFLASGLFHEGLLHHVMIPRATPEDLVEAVGLPRYHPYVEPAQVVYGGSTAFMLWCAFFITLEAVIGNHGIFQWMNKHLPRPILTILLISLALPIAHWFVDPYVRSDFFYHGGLGLPMLVPEVSSSTAV
eukprot:CAMPEP_0194041354 /NCGR_PEP_ID=MMETSP0009_2-20130614/13273_1 /TAXON_ID=210454 /ORGANISM="Grammatophora oceanica, Strain CCMP 410" /LENGTH=443 /DNA_ID=CAMNT_0038684835 /DNA_START=11 /DNA_END=1342 /DNA_ORIENTATION=+